MSDDVWIVLIEDRHADVEARPFSSEERAVEFGHLMGERSDGAAPAELTPGMREDGWVLYVPYGTEGDCIRVVKRSMDGLSGTPARRRARRSAVTGSSGDYDGPAVARGAGFLNDHRPRVPVPSVKAAAAGAEAIIAMGQPLRPPSGT